MVLDKEKMNIFENSPEEIVKILDEFEKDGTPKEIYDDMFGNYKDKYYDDTYFPRNKTFDVKKYQIDLSRKEVNNEI